MDILPALYQQFDPGKPLDAGDARYVDWQDELDADDLKTTVVNGILNSPEGGSIRLVTGLRGTGKTSELRRIGGILTAGHRDQQSVVVYVNRAGGWSGLPPEVVILKVAASMATDPALGAFLGGTSFADIGKRLGEKLKLKANLKVPFTGELSAAWEGQTAQRSEIEKVLKDNEGEFLAGVNAAISHALTAFKQSNIHRIVVIVDELDKLVDTDEIQRMFVGGQRWLKGLACDVVLTVPWEYHHSADGSQLCVQHGYGEVLELGVLPVDHRNGAPNESARKELQEIVNRRVAAARIAAPGGDLPAVFDRVPELIDLSGGQLRVLFEMLRKAINRAERADATERAVESSMYELATGVDPAQRELLTEIRSTKDARPDHPSWQSLLRNGRILLYSDHGRWYDVHPLLGRWLDLRATEGKP